MGRIENWFGVIIAVAVIVTIIGLVVTGGKNPCG